MNDVVDTPQLRLVIAGSVDDGKSTLVGRLLHDTKSILADQYDAIEQASHSRGANEFDLALLTDGLRAEREQGITIDVAYRYFSTPRRGFILADTPGHVQYTRNTVTGASTADAAVVLVDVRHGVSPQTRRHAAVLALLRVPHVIFAVNKMDAVDWSPDRFAEVEAQIQDLTRKVGLARTVVVPISALTGANVVAAGPDWYSGSPLLTQLEELPVSTERAEQPFRMAVQLVIRPRTAEHPDYRGLAGRIASGTVRVGDEIVASPSGLRSTVTAIDTPVGPALEAAAGESITLRLADELDLGRGDLLSGESAAPSTRELDGVLAWLAESPATPRQRVLVKVGTKTTRAIIAAQPTTWHVDDLCWAESAKPLELNDIGRAILQLAEPVGIDAYAQLRETGAFVLIDPDTGATLAAGMAGADLVALGT